MHTSLGTSPRAGSGAGRLRAAAGLDDLDDEFEDDDGDELDLDEEFDDEDLDDDDGDFFYGNESDDLDDDDDDLDDDEDDPFADID